MSFIRSTNILASNIVPYFAPDPTEGPFQQRRPLVRAEDGGSLVPTDSEATGHGAVQGRREERALRSGVRAEGADVVRLAGKPAGCGVDPRNLALAEMLAPVATELAGALVRVQQQLREVRETEDRVFDVMNKAASPDGDVVRQMETIHWALVNLMRLARHGVVLVSPFASYVTEVIERSVEVAASQRSPEAEIVIVVDDIATPGPVEPAGDRGASGALRAKVASRGV